MTATATARQGAPAADNDRLGVVTGEREVTFVRVLPGPIDRVWSFLADGEKRKKWLCGGDFEPRVGGLAKMRFHNAELTAPGEDVPERFKEYTGVMESQGRIIAWDPPHKLVFSWWGEPGEVSEVAFTLAEEPDGRVRLTLVHSALRNRGQMLSISGGWHAHLGVLVALAEDRRPDRFWSRLDEADKTYDGLLPAE